MGLPKMCGTCVLVLSYENEQVQVALQNLVLVKNILLHILHEEEEKNTVISVVLFGCTVCNLVCYN